MPVQINPKDPAAAPAPQESPAPAPDAAVAVEGQPITAPNVDQNKPPVATGPVPAGAEFEVLHAYVGEFRQGSYVKAADFGEGVDIDRLLRLEAIKPVAAPQGDAAKAKK